MLPIGRCKPLLLRVSPWALILAAIYVLVFSMVMVLERDSAAVGPLGTSGIGEFAAIVVGVLLSIILGSSGYGLHRDLPWARWVLTAGSAALLVGSCLFVLAAGPPSVAFPFVWKTMSSMAVVAFAAWYLFGSYSVRTYYSNLERL